MLSLIRCSEYIIGAIFTSQTQISSHSLVCRTIYKSLKGGFTNEVKFESFKMDKKMITETGDTIKNGYISKCQKSVSIVRK